jgi:hypothetical protein
MVFCVYQTLKHREGYFGRSHLFVAFSVEHNLVAMAHTLVDLDIYPFLLLGSLAPFASFAPVKTQLLPQVRHNIDHGS